MKNKKAVMRILVISSLFIAFVVAAWSTGGRSGVTTIARANESKIAEKEKEAKKKRTTGPMSLGKFFGQVVYDKEKELYFLELRGVRFPFKSSPIEAQDVLLEAPGKTDLEKNTSLLYGVLGKKVVHATLLIDPNEEDEVMPAVADLARYIQIANRNKFAGITYTKSGGKLKRSIAKGPQIQALEDATAKTPIILIKGPKSGAKKTRVVATESGKVIVEGKTFKDLYKAADRICITLIKMLCGSSDCPDAGACATGGSCGCG
jgi:hypothetical protein